MLKVWRRQPDSKNMEAITTTKSHTYRVEVKASTPREAIEYTRSILPVTVAKSLTLTTRRISASTFEVYA